MIKKIRSALISVYHKQGLDEIIPLLQEQNVTLYSTGGTQKLIESMGADVKSVENLTSYPSILDGRVKTLHPKVFGGILARREEGHLAQLEEFKIPELDLVVVDLYPFEDTLASTSDESVIIEKIDIGGISLIRAAAKNYRDIVVIPSQEHYAQLLQILRENSGKTDENQRRLLARDAFRISSGYDKAIASYFTKRSGSNGAHPNVDRIVTLRYGENPHQEGSFIGDLSWEFEQLHGKAISYNNLVDIEAAIELMAEFKDNEVTFAILKHTNSCGIATRTTLLEAYKAALAGDPISAFGGILIANVPIDKETAEEIDKQFYEVLIAPGFSSDALAVLKKKKNRILLKRKGNVLPAQKEKTLLSGTIRQSRDAKIEVKEDLKVCTEKSPSEEQVVQLLFANKVAKHLKSNTIVLVKDFQLIGMGCGQTSRVDAAKQAIAKAQRLGFDLSGSVMASDAFFPFPDCAELAHKAGVQSIIQPGGSRNDQLTIDYCNEHGLSMVLTGTRHFKH